MNEQIEGLSSIQIARLRRSLSCPIVVPSDTDYSERRKIWNGMIDRRPSVIIRPTSISCVMQAVRLASELGIAASVRGGGHSVAGKSVVDGAMMIDLSLMNEVQINPSRQTALAQGGATWGMFDREA